MNNDATEEININMKYYKFPITKEKNNKISDQMEKSICKIKIKDLQITGFFCNIPYQNTFIKVLITSSNVVDENILKEHKIINVTINDDKEFKNIEIKENKNIYTSTKYNTTIIEIIPAIDKIDNFLELDDNIFNDSSTNISNENIYIIHYPKYNNDQKAAVSYGLLEQINDYNIKFYCFTSEGSQGSPILRISNNKVIGIYKENNNNFNTGIFLKNCIKEFLSNIKKENKNKNNNISITPGNQIKINEKMPDIIVPVLRAIENTVEAMIEFCYDKAKAMSATVTKLG